MAPLKPALSSRLVHSAGVASICFGLSLAALGAAEVTARHWISVAPPDDVLAGRAFADVYAGQAWAPEFFQEFGGAREMTWRPYLYWRRRPFHGTYINVEAGGYRRTWSAPDAKDPVRKVFVFGGSVVWGEGARDEHTIPSYLAKALAEAGVTNVRVTNFAESGYVSMQEVIALADELRHGNVPAVAVFLDGVNDLFAVRQSGTPGITQNEANRVREFNIDVDGRIFREAASTFLRNSALFRAATGFSLPAPASLPPAEIDLLAGDAMRIYLDTIELARNLGHSYGFDTLFYWQPVVFTKGHLSPWETKIATDSPFEEFYVRSYAVAAEILAEAPHVRDLSGLFATEQEPRYIDFCHLGEQGNERIGREMAADAAPLLAVRSGAE